MPRALKSYSLRFCFKDSNTGPKNPDADHQKIADLNRELGKHWSHVARNQGARGYLETGGYFTAVCTEISLVMVIQGLIQKHGFELEAGIHVETKSRQVRCEHAFQLVAMFL